MGLVSLFIVTSRTDPQEEDLKLLVESLSLQVVALSDIVKESDYRFSKIQRSNSDFIKLVEGHLEEASFDIKVIDLYLELVQETLRKVYWFSLIGLGAVLLTMLWGITVYLRYV